MYSLKLLKVVDSTTRPNEAIRQPEPWQQQAHPTQQFYAHPPDKRAQHHREQCGVETKSGALVGERIFYSRIAFNMWPALGSKMMQLLEGPSIQTGATENS